MAMASENPSFSQPEPSLSPHRTDEDWSREPQESDPFVDIPAIQKRLNERHRKFGGLSVHYATFRMPWPVTQGQYEGFRTLAGQQWVRVMEKKGWTLRSKIHVSKPYAAYGTTGDWYGPALLDMREFHLRAAFSIDAKPLRLELPVKVVKEHRLRRQVSAGPERRA